MQMFDRLKEIDWGLYAFFLIFAAILAGIRVAIRKPKIRYRRRKVGRGFEIIGRSDSENNEG